MNLLSVDPGKGKRLGWAYFELGQLLEAGLGEIPDLFDELVTHVVIEQPRWYPKEREIDTNDLLDLAVLVGRIAGRFERVGKNVELVNPRDWKGTLRWDLCCKRVIEALTDLERDALPRRKRKKDVDHNVLDAVGIGLKKLRRFG